MSLLAINGGQKAVQISPGDISTWPIITAEDSDNELIVVVTAYIPDEGEWIAFQKRKR